MILLGLIGVSHEACINRTTAINRAMEWVKAGVPYDAHKYRDGYIQGCEGIVGYGWEFPTPGIPSWSLEGHVCKRITKGQLQKGDLMVHASSHELMFDGWGRDGYYWGIELSPGGAKRYQIKWPYWDSDNPSAYFPCQVDKACIQESYEQAQK